MMEGGRSNRTDNRNAIVGSKVSIGMNPALRFIFCVAVLVMLLPVAALGIVSGGQTIDGKVSVTYSPNRPVVGQSLTLRVSIDNIGTTPTTYRLCYQEPGAACAWYTLSVAPGFSQKYNIVYTPTDVGEITFRFSLYWFQNNQQMIPLQNETETVPIYSSQIPPTPVVTTPVTQTTITQTTIPPTTEAVGFDAALALLTLFAIMVVLKKVR
jgi:hypothetical protein